MTECSQEAGSPESDTDAEGDRSNKPISSLIEELPRQTTGERIAIGDLVLWFEDRATLALMLIFGILNILPNPPGSSVVLGLPMLYLSAAMLLDRQPWFPRIVMDRGISASLFQTLAYRGTPYLRRCEQLLRPRREQLSQGWAFRFSGLLCLILSIILILPIPFGNIPPAACMTFLVLALAMRDGISILLGWFLSLVCIILMSGVVAASVIFVWHLLVGLLS
ncbi:exopolysaccharide biosynthesis protein [Paracoccus caeni]|uniref:Exopolysaccharide biosynthesis protein n=1 Tax=Paracoccus caeni TaxID=657651 RepID=A0A934SLR8_9RHOB|nr:exopolysaccharide biosynthesis protein [Paracoccus caeni]MBK4216688.1 exopolysaccharide biosynthesis protein [Paracoccus caeni]